MMFNSIILLTAPGRETALSARLLQQNSQLKIYNITTLQALEAIEPSVLLRSRLIAFATPVIVRMPTLNDLAFGAYNFHQGPPQYPGWMPSEFAAYDHAISFGVTAHEMTERIGMGPIVGRQMFDMPSNAAAAEFERRAFVELVRLFW